MKKNILIVALSLCFLLAVYRIYQLHDVTIKKSSDSEWEYSDIKMPDTTIVDTLVINGVKVFPTVQYLNIKIK